MSLKNGMISVSNEKALVEFLSMKRRDYEISLRESFEKFDREERNPCMSISAQLCQLNHEDKEQKTTLQDTGKNLVKYRAQNISLLPSWDSFVKYLYFFYLQF